MKNLKKRYIFFVVFCFFSLIFQIYFASQVYLGLTLDAVEIKEISSLNTNSSFEPFSNNNTRNAVFQFSGETLEISAERGQNDSSKTIFEVRHSVAIPLREDSTLSFSILARELNIYADAGRLYLALSNGTHTIILNYVVGYAERDWKQGTFSYVFHKIGDKTNTWFNVERNLWNDLIDKNFSLKSSWDVTSIAFGCISYWKTPRARVHKMNIFLNVSETSVYYKKSTFTRVIPTIQVSWFAFCEMIAGLLLFLICSVILIRTRKQLKSNEKKFLKQESVR